MLVLVLLLLLSVWDAVNADAAVLTGAGAEVLRAQGEAECGNWRTGKPVHH